jgi:hypothetical protein
MGPSPLSVKRREMEATKNPAHSRRGFGVGYVQIAIARAEPKSPEGKLFSTTGLRTKS